MDYWDYVIYRNSKGLKDADVSRLTGISKSTLSDWKNGKSKPKNDKLLKIGKLLNIPTEKILGADNIEFDHEHPAEGFNAGNMFSGISSAVRGIDKEQYYLMEEARDMAEFLFNNPEYKLLFDASKKVKPEDIKKALTALGLFAED